MRLIVICIFFVSNYAFAHGNIDNKNGACTLKISENHAIHLTAYQPSTHEGDVFCQDAPDLVETIIVLDFMEEDLKKLPFSFVISYINGEALEPLAALPLSTFPMGSMLLKFLPPANGIYRGKVVFLDEKGHDSSREFDFYVGEQSPNSSEPSGTQDVVRVLIILVFGIGGLYFLYLKVVNRKKEEF